MLHLALFLIVMLSLFQLSQQSDKQQPAFEPIQQSTPHCKNVKRYLNHGFEKGNENATNEHNVCITIVGIGTEWRPRHTKSRSVMAHENATKVQYNIIITQNKNKGFKLRQGQRLCCTHAKPCFFCFSFFRYSLLMQSSSETSFPP